MQKRNHVWLLRAALLLSLFIFHQDMYSGSETGFTQQDREMLIELKATMKEIDKRFEQIDKRFEQVDKRISELREDMNKRFEQVDKRFEQMMSFVWILAALFGGMLAVTISFALWDRRTMVRPFETKVAVIDSRINKNEEKITNLIAAIKEYAAKDKKFAALIERFNIL